MSLRWDAACRILYYVFQWFIASRNCWEAPISRSCWCFGRVPNEVDPGPLYPNRLNTWHSNLANSHICEIGDESFPTVTKFYLWWASPDKHQHDIKNYNFISRVHRNFITSYLKMKCIINGRTDALPQLEYSYWLLAQPKGRVNRLLFGLCKGLAVGSETGWNSHRPLVPAMHCNRPRIHCSLVFRYPILR